MKQQPLVSVEISSYNHENFIQETIKSIINQTYQNMELIVYDDGSTDKTFEKLCELREECEKRFVRVVFEKNKNRGCVRQLNALYAEGQGKYVFNSASDDVAKPDAIRTLVDYMENHQNCVRVVGDDEIINSKSERVYWDEDRKFCDEQKAVWKTFGEFCECYTNHKDNFGTYLALLKGNHIPNGMMTRYDAIRKIIPVPEHIILEDWYWNIQLAKYGTIDFIPQILFSYRWHEHNTITNPDFVAKRKFITDQILTYEREYCFSHGLKKEWKKIWRQGHPSWWKKVRRLIKVKLKDFVKLK